MTDRDRDLQALFAAADHPLETADFTQTVMLDVARAERTRLWRRGAFAVLIGFVAWGLSLEALPLFLSQSFIDPASIGLGGHWVAEALSPVNSLAGLLTLVLLGLRALYRRILG